ncbi:hypothetical protein BJY01DRAFT_215888 [Aspergillus pseudoustus]|uniref:Uncharacterized protein n=1 Tax=Aspergillus pseudoustus TaxID=1810923 RepID=A0ABR4JTI3_9EURO
MVKSHWHALFPTVMYQRRLGVPALGSHMFVLPVRAFSSARLRFVFDRPRHTICIVLYFLFGPRHLNRQTRPVFGLVTLGLK